MNITEELGKLEELYRKGSLSEEEFKNAKAAVLGGSKETTPPPVGSPTPSEPPKKKSAMLDPKTNFKALARIVILLIVLGVAVWFFISRMAGTKAATDLVKSVAHAPMTLRDSVENLQASSWKGVPVKLPYSGTLSVSVQVVSGNKIEVFMADEANLEKFKHDDKNFRVLMQAAKTQDFKQSARLSAGVY